MKKIIFFIITLVLFFIQNTILARFSVSGVIIPLFYTFGIVSAIYGDEWDAVFFGLLTGFLMDIYSPNLFGLNMFLNMNVFLGARLLSNYLRKDKIPVVVLLSTLATVLIQALAYGLYRLYGYVANPRLIAIYILLSLLTAIPMTLLSKWTYNLPIIKRINRI